MTLCVGTFYDGTTLYVNSCTCTEQYRPTNRPIVVDLPLNKDHPPRVVPLEEQEFEATVNAASEQNIHNY